MNRLSIFYEHIAEAAEQSGLSLEETCRRVKGCGLYGYGHGGAFRPEASAARHGAFRRIHAQCGS